MKLVSRITVAELNQMAEKMYGNLVKAVVDIVRKEVVIDAELHVDEEQFLLEKGSQQSDLWGINLYPDNFGADDFIEFDSMINIRPRAKNFSRNIEDKEIQQKIREIIAEVVNE